MYGPYRRRAVWVRLLDELRWLPERIAAYIAADSGEGAEVLVRWAFAGVGLVFLTAVLMQLWLRFGGG